jgi:branched-chain amino acid transport system permease protein
MSVADAAVGQDFAADLAVRGRRARVPDWLLNPVTGVIWLVFEGVFFIAHLYPFVAFNLAGAALVYLDHRRGDAGTWPWTLATVVLGPVAFVPYTYWRRRGLPGLEVLQEKWLTGEVPAADKGRLEELLHPVVGFAWIGVAILGAIVAGISSSGGSAFAAVLGIINLIAAVAVVLDHRRVSGASILWGVGTLVLGPLVFIPYSFLRRNRPEAETAKAPPLTFGVVPRPAMGLLIIGIAFAYPYVIPEVMGTSGVDLLDASVNSLAYVMMALGLNIVVGFAGLLDLGYVAFFAIGAFVMGWFGSAQFPDSNVHILVSSITGNLPGIHVNFVLIAIAAAGFTALWGAILGAPTLRLRGDYLAIVTLAFGEIVPRVFELSTSGPFGIGTLDISHGRQGITPVDKIYFPGVGTLQYPLELRGIYFVVLAMVAIVLFINIRLRDSRLGRAWIAVREDEVAAAAMGVNLVRTKLWAYAIGAAIGGAAGAFLGTYKNTVNVDQFEFGFSVFILCMVIIGGMGNIWGVILGAIALSMVDRFVLSWINENIDIGFDITAINFGIFGFFLLIMMVLRPEGILPSRRRKMELTGGGEVDDSLYEVEQE